MNNTIDISKLPLDSYITLGNPSACINWLLKPATTMMQFMDNLNNYTNYFSASRVEDNKFYASLIKENLYITEMSKLNVVIKGANGDITILANSLSNIFNLPKQFTEDLILVYSNVINGDYWFTLDFLKRVEKFYLMVNGRSTVTEINLSYAYPTTVISVFKNIVPQGNNEIDDEYNKFCTFINLLSADSIIYLSSKGFERNITFADNAGSHLSKGPYFNGVITAELYGKYVNACTKGRYAYSDVKPAYHAQPFRPTTIEYILNLDLPYLSIHDFYVVEDTSDIKHKLNPVCFIKYGKCMLLKLLREAALSMDRKDDRFFLDRINFDMLFSSEKHMLNDFLNIDFYLSFLNVKSVKNIVSNKYILGLTTIGINYIKREYVYKLFMEYVHARNWYDGYTKFELDGREMSLHHHTVIEILLLVLSTEDGDKGNFIKLFDLFLGNLDNRKQAIDSFLVYYRQRLDAMDISMQFGPTVEFKTPLDPKLFTKVKDGVDLLYWSGFFKNCSFGRLSTYQGNDENGWEADLYIFHGFKKPVMVEVTTEHFSKEYGENYDPQKVLEVNEMKFPFNISLSQGEELTIKSHLNLAYYGVATDPYE